MLGVFIFGVIGGILICLGFATDKYREKEKELLTKRVQKLEEEVLKSSDRG